MREQANEKAKQPEQRREQPKQPSKRRPMDTLSEDNPLICRGID